MDKIASESRSIGYVDHPIFPIFAGILTAQIIGACQVYLSNRHLSNAIQALAEAGRPSPVSAGIAERLLEPSTALYGGIFFSLTIGAGLSLAAFAAARAWARIFNRKISMLIALMAIWSALTAIHCLQAFCIVTSLYFVLVPPMVFWMTLKTLPGRFGTHPLRELSMHTLPILILGLLWTTQADPHLFSNIRDRLLNPFPAGKEIVNFYYRYTFHAAEAIKPLMQKRVKTCVFDGQNTDPFKERFRDIPAFNGWQLVENKQKGDLIISDQGEYVTLGSGNHAVLNIRKDIFFLNPAQSLNRFSRASDPFFAFRKSTFYSLLFAFPMILYLSLHGFLFFLLKPFVQRKTALITATALSFQTGLFMFFLFIWT